MVFKSDFRRLDFISLSNSASPFLVGILETVWDKHSVTAATPPPSPTSGESGMVSPPRVLFLFLKTFGGLDGVAIAYLCQMLMLIFLNQFLAFLPMFSEELALLHSL